MNFQYYDCFRQYYFQEFIFIIISVNQMSQLYNHMNQQGFINESIIKMIKMTHLIDSNAFSIVLAKFQGMINLSDVLNNLNKRMDVKQIPSDFHINQIIQAINTIYSDACFICHHALYKEKHTFNNIMKNPYIKHIIIVYKDEMQTLEDLQRIHNINNRNKIEEIDFKEVRLKEKQLIHFLQLKIADNFIINKEKIIQFTQTIQTIVAQIKQQEIHKSFKDLQAYFMIIGLKFSQTVEALSKLYQNNTINILQLYANKYNFNSINILLRRSYQLSIIRYVRLAINYIYRDINKSKILKDFIGQQKKCYRGCMINEQEILQLRKNIGNIITNRFFMSTSLSLYIAEQFSINCLIVIELTEQCLGGFCFLSKTISNNYEEKQILFNLNNKFKVISVEQNMSKVSQSWIISLEHLTSM